MSTELDTERISGWNDLRIRGRNCVTFLQICYGFLNITASAVDGRPTSPNWVWLLCDMLPRLNKWKSILPSLRNKTNDPLPTQHCFRLIHYPATYVVELPCSLGNRTFFLGFHWLPIMLPPVHGSHQPIMPS